MAQTLESGYVTTLASKLSAADTTMTVATAPTVTKGRLFLKSGSVKEWIKFTGVSGTTLTGLVRGLSKTADPSTSGTGLTWVAGTTVTLVEMHDQMSDKQEGMPVKVYATTTARDADITSPSNGMQCYVTADGTFYDYVAGAWTTRANGTNVNASATVAGRVEIATTAQSIAGTDTGETGALLSALPSDIAKNTQSGTFVYGADAGGDDTYVVALTPVLTAYTTGQSFRVKFTTANTGACTIDFGPGVKSIKNKFGYDPRDGEIAALGTYNLIYDGTNFVLQDKKILTAFGTGADGALAISSGTTTIPLSNNYIEKNYSSMSITGTATLTFSGATTTGGIAVLNCAGDFTMSGTATISMEGMGGVLGLGGTAAGAGTAGTNGTTIIRGVNRTAAITTGTLDFGGFYKGYCGAGGTGGDGGNANAGTNAGGTGGNAGGLLIIRVGGAINFSAGTITCAGSNGGNGVNTGGAGSGGGGGGAGGGIIILYNNLISTAGTLNVNGGNGGNGAVGVAGLGTGGAGGAGGASFSNAGGGGAINTSGTNGTSNSFGTGGTGGTSGGSGGGNNGGGGGGGGGAGFYIVDYYEEYRN